MVKIFLMRHLWYYDIKYAYFLFWDSMFHPCFLPCSHLLPFNLHHLTWESQITSHEHHILIHYNTVASVFLFIQSVMECFNSEIILKKFFFKIWWNCIDETIAQNKHFHWCCTWVILSQLMLMQQFLMVPHNHLLFSKVYSTFMPFLFLKVHLTLFSFRV